jgi:NUMOD3 motif
MEHYTYLYLREDGSPYYAGKGQGRRAYVCHKGHKPPEDRSRISLQYWLDEATAYAYEVYLIDFWGRKDLGTGILINHTDGGDKPPSHKGRKQSEAHKQKIGKALRGVAKSEKSRTRMSASHTGLKASPEHRKNLSEGHKGKKLSEATKRKISIKARVRLKQHRKYSAFVPGVQV